MTIGGPCEMCYVNKVVAFELRDPRARVYQSAWRKVRRSFAFFTVYVWVSRLVCTIPLVRIAENQYGK